MVWLEVGLHLDTYRGIGVPVHPDFGVSWKYCEKEFETNPNSQFVSCPDGHYDTIASPDSSMIHNNSVILSILRPPDLY